MPLTFSGLRTWMPSRTYHVYRSAYARRGPPGSQHLEHFDLVQDVVAQDLAIDVAPQQRARHEAVEVGCAFRWALCLERCGRRAEQDCGDDSRAGEKTTHMTSGGRQVGWHF